MELNKIYCENNLETMKRMPDNFVDLVIADPPYNVGIDYGITTDDKRIDYAEWIDAVFVEMLRVGKTVFITPGNANQHLYPKPKWTLCWIKKNGMTRTPLTVGNKMTLCTWEPVLVYGDKLKNPPFHDSFEYSISNQAGASFHPCPKPIDLFSKLISIGTNENDIVYDPFMGSGTTAISAAVNNRRFIGSEISQEYVDLANKRLDPYLRQERLAL